MNQNYSFLKITTRAKKPKIHRDRLGSKKKTIKRGKKYFKREKKEMKRC